MLFGNKQVIGLDIGTSSIKMVELKAAGRSYKMTKFGMAPIKEGVVEGGEIIDPSELAQVILALHKELGMKNKNICTGMFGGAVIVKKISMPRTDPKMIREQIHWEAEAILPFDLNEVNLDYHLMNGSHDNAETMDVLLVAAKHDYIIRYFEAIEIAGLKCSLIDVNGFALANCFEMNYGIRAGESIALLNIGAGVSNFVVVENGDVTFSRDIPLGGSLYNLEISRELGVSPQEAEELKIGFSHEGSSPVELTNVINNTNEILIEEIKESFRFYYDQTKSQAQVNEIFLSGGTVKLPNLLETIARATETSCQILNPFNNVGFNKKEFNDEYIQEIFPFLCCSIGLAGRKVGDS